MFFAYCFFFKQKTAYEMRISDWSSDVCSSDLSSPVGAILSNSSATVSIGNYFRFVEGDTSGAAISDDGYTITPVGGGAGLGSTRYVISEDISLIPAGAYYFEEIGRASCRERVCQ